MRRKDRALNTMAECVEVVSRCMVCRLGLWDGNEVYIVPLNFGYTWEDGELVLYFHSAPEGRKLNMMRKFPMVSFEMDCGHHLLPGTVPCRYGYAYESVIGRGRIDFPEKEEDRIAGLQIMMKHQTGRDFSITPEMLKGVIVYRLVVTSFSGKRRSLPSP